jgi:hypothetical protein
LLIPNLQYGIMKGGGKAANKLFCKGIVKKVSICFQ